MGSISKSAKGKCSPLWVHPASERVPFSTFWGVLIGRRREEFFTERWTSFHWPPAELARFRNERVGFIFQFHHLLPEFSAIENVMMPALIRRADTKAAAETAANILVEVGLGSRLHHRPGELSGGEQQRVAVARALVLKPDVVLADEPTGNLDAHTGEAIHDLLLSINKQRGITFVIVTHNDKLAIRADRVLRMADGKLAQAHDY